MPIHRMKEIREMDPEERQKKLQELNTELRKLKTTIKAGGAIENPGRIRLIRRTIARFHTVNSEEEL